MGELFKGRHSGRGTHGRFTRRRHGWEGFWKVGTVERGMYVGLLETRMVGKVTERRNWMGELLKGRHRGRGAYGRVTGRGYRWKSFLCYVWVCMCEWEG